MTTEFDLRDILCLAIAVRAKVHSLRPELEFYPTCNPGNAKPGISVDEHYIALCERVYEYRDMVSTPWPGRFIGYVTYRCNEVRYKSKQLYLPEISSVEVRKADFSTFLDGKVHVSNEKVLKEDPNLVSQATALVTANPSGRGIAFDLAQEVTKRRLPLIVDKIIQMVDGTLK